MTPYPLEIHQAQLDARTCQETEAFQKMYQKRAGIEGTISPGVRKLGLRKSHYIGLQRTRLQHLTTAAAINLFRVFDWQIGMRPNQTPVPASVALAASQQNPFLTEPWCINHLPKKGLLRLGVGQNLTRIVCGNLPRRIAPADEVLALRPDLKPPG